MNMYDLARGLHIIAVIAWMAGLLMLPRLYAYQMEAQPGGELERKMIDAAAKLRSIILTPALAATWVLGLWLLHYDAARLGEPWLIGKLALVIAITGLHGFYVSEGKKLARGERRRSAKFWRMINEIPFVIAIGVVLLATLEPH